VSQQEPYKSSHLAGAVSELIVPSDHAATAHSFTVLEVKRILKLHLQQAGLPNQNKRGDTGLRLGVLLDATRLRRIPRIRRAGAVWRMLRWLNAKKLCTGTCILPPNRFGRLSSIHCIRGKTSCTCTC
jgi:hypothetical protein